MDSPKENSPPKLHTLRDLQNNKFICKRISFGDGTEHHDSGYASTSAHSTTNIEHDSMSSLSAVGSFHAPKRDCGDSCTSTLHLEPIVEDIQSGQFAQSSAAELTPTTRNIAKINSFHITTPSSPAPVKRIASSPLRHIGNTPLKTMRLNTTTPHKPKDATASDGNITSTLSGRKLWQQCREPLRSKLNVDDDNVFSMDENSNGEHPLLSSTPNNFNKLNKAKGNTITRGSNVERSRSFASRNKVLRKTISFSPSKHFQSVYERKPTATNIVSDLPAISTHSPNPARKLLDFNEDKFDKLTQPAQKILQRQYAFDTDTDYLNMSPARHTITSAQYLNEAFDIADKYDLFEAEKTPPEFPNMSMTPPKCDAMDICSPTDCVIPPPLHEDTAAQYMLKNCSSNTDSSRQIDLLLHSDIVPESPPPSQNRSNGIVDDMQRTPKKQSCGFSVFNSTPRQEQNCILYPKLQRTPPRNQRLLKRLSSNQGIQRAPVKRKLYRQASSSFIGSEKIDILGHLEDNLPAVDLVLAALSSQDLANLTRVSKRCFRIVHSNVSANKRVENYLRNQYGAKENVGCTTNTNKKIKVVRPPFTRCNSSRQILISSTKLPANSPKLSPKNENEKFLKDIKVSKIVSFFPIVLFIKF